MTEKTSAVSVDEQPLPEHEQIAIALNPRLVGPLLEELFQPEHIRKRSDNCFVLDAKYEPGHYCTILYQLGGDLIIGSYHWDSGESQIPGSTRIIPSVGMQVFRFPDDPSLPSLTSALDPQALSAALVDALPELKSHARILTCNVKPLRFRPGRRCTVRLELWLRDKETKATRKRVLYGKIYHDLEKAERVYHQMLALSDSPAAQQGRISYATASAFLPDLAMVLQNPVQGVPLDSLLSCDTTACNPRGVAGTAAAGSALAAFHTGGPAAGKSRSISSELARFKKRGARIGRINSALGEQIDRLADALSAWLDTLDHWGATICLVHGDCKPAQFLIHNAQVALLDFDHCGMADPAVDVGTFLATLQQMQVKQTMKNHGKPARSTAWMPDLKQQFLEAYCRASGSPTGFTQRAAWYEAVGLLRKAIRGFERSPFSPLPAALVVEAWKGLETLPPPFQS